MRALTAAACALVFFLGSADLVFGVRVLGVNVRIANLVLAAGLIAWARRDGPAIRAELPVLMRAWGPFVAFFALASVASAFPAAGLIKIGWFAFNLLSAYAWCRLFRPRDLAGGYFACFVAIALVIIFDFVTGFTGGPAHMIGYGQGNDLTAGQFLYRPHAFYYEPSYASSGLALAWGLALSRIHAAAPRLATALVGVGVVALVFIMSRTGWLYVAVFSVLLVLTRERGVGIDRAQVVRNTGIALVAAAVAVSIGLASADNRDRFALLLGPLGVDQTFERACPIVREAVPALGLKCPEGDSRGRYVDQRHTEREPDASSEAQRIRSARDAIARIERHPLLGEGVAPGTTRLVEPVGSNVWLEIGSEGGLLSLAAFVWGLGYTLWRWRAFAPGNRAIVVALATYFVVAWQFLQTFPRLDQWLSFWLALTWAAHEPATEADLRRSASSTGSAQASR